MTTSSWAYQFGALVQPHKPITLTFGDIAPIHSYEDTIAMLEAETHEDGCLYPPAFCTRRVNINGSVVHQEEAIVTDRAATRPAHLYGLPPTHRLTYRGSDARDVDRAVPEFLLHVLGFLYGTRLQFSDWYIDQRVRLRRQKGLYPWEPATPFSFDTEELTEVLERSVTRARELSREQRNLLRNIISTHNRCPSYEWSWERFTWRYTTLDALWRFFDPGRNDKASHRERLARLCAKFEIPDEHTVPVNEEQRQRIADLRNNLVHEATWNNSGLDHDGDGPTFMAEIFLGQLNERLILHALEVPCDFRCTPWRSFSRHPFRKYDPPQHPAVGDDQATGREPDQAHRREHRIAEDALKTSEFIAAKVPT